MLGRPRCNVEFVSPRPWGLPLVIGFVQSESEEHMRARIGICVTTMVVTSVDARLGGRVNWGFPKELGTVSWLEEGDDRILRWEERVSG